MWHHKVRIYLNAIVQFYTFKYNTFTESEVNDILLWCQRDGIVESIAERFSEY